MNNTLVTLNNKIESKLDSITGDTFWLLFNALMVFFMQTGFAMLEVGSVNKKNTKNILTKNLLDACLGALIWWSFGHGIAYDGTNTFIGMPYNGKSSFFMCTPHNNNQPNPA